MSFYPLEFLVSRIAGDAVDVRNLTPPGVEPHDLELRPSDIRDVRRADLVVYLGGGFQPALEDALEDVPPQVELLDVLPRLRDPVLEDDPHIWLSYDLYKFVLARVWAELDRIVPTEARAPMQDRQRALVSDLTSLDSELRAAFRTCARRTIFTAHTAFAHFAKAYGFDQVGIEGVAPEGEPSPRRLQEVARAARAARATTIYFERLVSPRVAKAVARIVGAETAVLDPIENAEPGEDYFTLMRRNMRTLVAGQGCRT